MKNNSFFNSFTLQGIFNNRKKSIFKALLHLLLITMLMYFPLSFDWINKTTIDYQTFGITFIEDIPSWFPNDLPNCYFKQQKLYCENSKSFVYNGFTISFFEEQDTNNVAFLEDYFLIKSNDLIFQFNYVGFNDFAFADLNKFENNIAAKYFLDSMFISVKSSLLLPLMLFIYFSFFIMNFVYLLILSGISMSLQFRNINFPKFKEVLVMYVYASTIPSIIALFFILITATFAFTPIFYNFLTPIIMFIIYNKYIKKS